MSGTIPSLSQYAFMAKCSIKENSVTTLPLHLMEETRIGVKPRVYSNRISSLGDQLQANGREPPVYHTPVGNRKPGSPACSQSFTRKKGVQLHA
jgi:hypothetical protein